MSIQPTQAVCPSNMHGATHHLIPKRVGSESSELTCIFCRQSESAIRAELAQQEEPPVQPPPVHVQTLTISPDLEVIGSCQDCSWHEFGDVLVAHEEIRTWAREHAVERGHAAAVTKTNRTTTTFRVLPREESWPTS